MWPEKDIPEDYLDLAKKLVTQKIVSEREFIDLCKLAVSHINSGQINVRTRSDMALYIANLWLNHANIGDRDLLSAIGGQFADWDIPGTFVIDDDLRKPYWEDLQAWIKEADAKYPA